MAEKIKDSGEMREFETGAHRDSSTGKGRIDLLPFEAVNSARNTITESEKKSSINYVDYLEEAFWNSSEYLNTNDINLIAKAARAAIIATGMKEGRNEIDINDINKCFYYGLMKVSVHYEAGATKYGANNWQKGMPINVFLDSGMRHTIKAISGIQDEPHCRASSWNYLCAIWTKNNIKENDLE